MEVILPTLPINRRPQKYTAAHIAPLVWYIYDAGEICAELDDSQADNPRDEETMRHQAEIMAAALNASGL